MEYSHIGSLVFENAKKYDKKAALMYKDGSNKGWTSISWNELCEQVKQVAYSLIEMDVKEEEKVAIFSQNMAEIIVIDLACQALRITAVPMYATSSTSQIEYIIKDAGIELIFAGEQYQFDRSVEALHSENPLKKIVVIDPNVETKGEAAAIPFRDFLEKGNNATNAEATFKERLSHLTPDDLCTLIYTSGTTGEPKGVMLTDANYVQAMKIHDIRLVNVEEGQSSLSFLPLSHVFERAWTYYCLHKGVVIYVNRNPREIQEALKEVHPNLMCAVPRFWEKVYMGVHEKIESFPTPLQKIANHAISIGKERNISYTRLGKKAPTLLEWRYQFYNKTLFHVLRKAIGIEKSVMFPCAGSQLADEVNIFLHSVGVNIVVGYGLTETTATVSCYNPYSVGYDIESAGDPMPELEIKIGEDNEILLKGKTITKGYYNKPQANAEAFIDGWFRTGDAGRLLPNGRLVIVERIKELFKTSNGKYIAPQQLENKLVVDKYIEQVAVIGDLRKFVSALVVPAYDVLKDYAEKQGIPFQSMEELLKKPEIHDFYEERIQRLLSDLAAYEQVKKFTLLPQPFTPENDELTLTLKLKRKVINQHYEKEIESMYC